VKAQNMGMESIVQERQTFSSKLNEIQQALIRNTYIILVEREIKSQDLEATDSTTKKPRMA